MVNADYNKAYSDMTESLTSSLWAIETPDSATEFVIQASQYVRSRAANVPEFYIGEFLNIFKNAVVDRCRVDIAACERAIADAKAEAESATVELQARLESAIAVFDREAEHAIWREREARQATCQAKIDASTRHMDSISLRLDTCGELASALGAGFK